MISSMLLFFSFSGAEVMLILFVALILFGGEKFPEIARGLGKGIREFKDMSDGVKREIHTQINSYDSPPVEQPFPQTTTPIVEAPHEIVAATPEAPVVPHEASVANHEPVAPTAPQQSTPTMPKPDLTQPPNTISHQSY